MGPKKIAGFDYSSDEEESVRKVVLAPKKKKPKLFIPARLSNEPMATQEHAAVPNEQQPSNDLSFVKSETFELSRRGIESESEGDYLSMAIVEDEVPSFNLKKPNQDADTHKGLKYDEVQASKRNDALKRSLFGQILDNPISEEKHISSVTLGNSKGLSIMERMGFKVGQALGKLGTNDKAIIEPIYVAPRNHKLGLGAIVDTLRIADETTTDDYRKRMALEDEHKRNEKVIYRMQKLCFEQSGDCDIEILKINPLDITVLWRSYVIQLKEKASIKLRNVLDSENTSESDDGDSYHENRVTEETKTNENEIFLKIHTDFNDTTEIDKKIDENNTSDVDGEYDINNDIELAEFNKLTTTGKLTKLHMFLRSEMDYCYFCGVKYLDQKDLFESCPGLTESDHL